MNRSARGVKSVKRFEWSNGLDTALYKNYLYLLPNMKVSEQCRIAAFKGNKVIGMIRRNITYREKSFIVPLYKAIVRPHLEYCIQAWNPYLRKDIDMLECRGEQLNSFQD